MDRPDLRLVYAEQPQQQSNSLPVNQQGEIYTYGVIGALFGSAFVSDIVEIASGDLSLTNGAGMAIPAAYAAGFAGYNAIRAYRETHAYHTAPGDRFYTPETINRRSFARSMRTIGWGGGVMCLGEVSVIEAVKVATESGSLKEVAARLGVSVLTAAGTVFSGRGLIGSLRKRRELKHLADVFAEEQSARKELADS